MANIINNKIYTIGYDKAIGEDRAVFIDYIISINGISSYTYNAIYNGSSPSVQWRENNVSDFYDDTKDNDENDKQKITRYDLLDFDD